jgi:large conductance mechanosensitive channel
VIQTAITIGFGTFVATILDFILVALVVFFVVKAINTARKLSEKKKAEAEAAAPPAPPAPSKEEVLLTEIRDLLKNK